MTFDNSNVFVLYNENPDFVSLFESFLDGLFCKNFSDSMGLTRLPKNIKTDIDRSIKKSVYLFSSNIYLFYQLDNINYVDINQVISCITSDPNEHKNIFRNFSEYIVDAVWTETNDNYVKRELIDLNTLGRLLLSSNSHFSEIFRIECASYMFLIQKMQYLMTNICLVN